MKRRLILQLGDLGLPIVPWDVAPGGLGFDLLSSIALGRQVRIGHANGIISLDLAESLDDRREALRVRLGEPYRTMLGHLRHEVGHYFQNVLLTDDTDWARCRDLFGDERASYQDAIKRHYKFGAPDGWQDSFISEYATMHPWEDFAETFAHYLHITGTLQTAAALGIHLDAVVTNLRDTDVAPLGSYRDEPVAQLLSDWEWMSQAFNRINRAMGFGDLYPFVIAAPVRKKLGFMHDIVTHAPLTTDEQWALAMPRETGEFVTTFARGQRVIGHFTHFVENQPEWRVGLDEYEVNAPLVSAVEAFGAGWANEALHEAGALVGSADFQRDAELANTRVPAAYPLDRWGFRLDEVEYDESYHRILGAAVARGAHTSAWAAPRAGAHTARAAMFMLFAQIEPGHACPVSMTHAAVATLADSPWVAEEWLPRMYSRTYEPRLLPAEQKAGALIGMAMTEKQGGSDVRAGTTLGIHMGGHAYQLTGHKWFCSAPMSDGFLVLAQTRRGTDDEGLSCLFVPRVLPHGMRNVFRIQRLKDKLGNRSNASAEVEFDGTVGTLVGEPGRGVRAIIEMVQRTRLDCVLGTAAGMRQSVSEAIWHARGRTAFGARLVDQPAMTTVLADLALESEAAMLTGLRLAQMFEDEASDRDLALRRLATPVSKYQVCKRGPHHAYEALECLGGNGYTESFPLARRYREQPVMAIWEGSGNVIALDVLRALARDPECADAFADELARTQGASAVLDAHVARTLTLLVEMTADPATAETHARRLSEALALSLQASLMIRHAPSVDAETFVATRLGEDRAAQYGVLPRGTDAAAIVARH